MAELQSIHFTEEQVRILDSVMQGGTNWQRYIAEGGSCLKKCPFYQQCQGSGPDKICSKQWRNAETNPEVLDVLFHVVNNFDYYNQGDLSVSDGHQFLAEIRRIVHDLLVSIDEEEFEEGSQHLRVHLYRERKSEASQKKKKEALAQGHLICEACGIDYLALYEGKGIRLIECHHTIPLSSEMHTGKTRKGDLLLLCANCHRLAHAESPPIPLHALRLLVQRHRENQ